jgi:hypothetical protein
MDPGAHTAAEPASTPLLPPPPPPAPSPTFTTVGGSDEPKIRPVKVAGQLSPAWQLIFGLGWAAIIACQAALWESSRVIGLSTWWLGADAQPRFIVFQLLPFYGPIVVTIAAISNWRYSPYLGIAAAVVGAAIGAGDLGRVRWIAVVELVLAGAGLCISVASLVGMYRPAAPAAPSTSIS